MNLPLDIELWPDLYREAYEERAGIIECEGGFPRWKAQVMAERDIRQEAARDWESLT